MKPRFLDQCEQELLHLSGAIQAHGALIIASRQGICRHVSENIQQFAGHPVEQWLNRPMPAEPVDWLNLLSHHGSRRLVLYKADLVGRTVDIILTRLDNGDVGIELLPHVPWSKTSHISFLEPAPDSEVELGQMQQALTDKIAAITGFQRVMLYSFREDGDGEVIAETVASDGHYGTYVGLRFPASDIPQIARKLYLRTPWRFIADALAAPVPLLGNEESADLSLVDLRSVSPVHCTYLTNMGVRSSLSFPVILNGALVALVACHHRQASVLSPHALEFAAEHVRAYNVAVTRYHACRRIRLIDGLTQRFATVKQLLQRNGDLESAWPELAPWLVAEFKVDGACLVLGDRFVVYGNGFEPDALGYIDDWFCHDAAELVWQCDSLRWEFPDIPLSQVAGAMAMRITIQTGSVLRIYLTRLEHIHEVAWGGNPDKPVEYHDGQLGIAPRRSFEKWLEKRMGYCRPWENESRLLLHKLRDLLQSFYV